LAFSKNTVAEMSAKNNTPPSLPGFVLPGFVLPGFVLPGFVLSKLA
jgi:hypothetical protein